MSIFMLCFAFAKDSPGFFGQNVQEFLTLYLFTFNLHQSLFFLTSISLIEHFDANLCVILIKNC
jgi:hypothetical protein